MSFASGQGKVITFYSWKGGVGRTMALANTAVQLARAGRSVLMIDWDLEAPGLDQYFLRPGKLEADKLRVTPARDPVGLMGLLDRAAGQGDGRISRDEWEAAVARIGVPPADPTVTAPTPPTPGRLDLLPAGPGGKAYAEQLAGFSWERFYAESRGGAWLEAARKEWSTRYDFVLIDSRTGLSDAGGICTIQMPDILVLVFTANDQSFNGGMKVVETAQKGRRDFGVDRGQLTVVPLLSRWCGDAEVDIADEWMRRFNEPLKPVVGSWLPKEFGPRQLLERLRVPHVARFSFGEPLPVLTHSLTDPELPGHAFQLLARLLGSGMAEAGEIIEPGYRPPVFTAGLTRDDDLRLLSIASDPAALRQEIARVTRVHGEHSRETLATLRSAGRVLFTGARFSEAEPLFRQAVALSERLFGPDSHEVAVDLANLAVLLKETNRTGPAEPLMNRALKIDERMLGPSHPDVAIILSNLALLLKDTGRIEEAQQLMKRALTIQEGALGPSHPSVAISLNNLAQLLEESGRLDEAEPMLRRALAINESNFGPNHPSVATHLSNLAMLLRATNRLEEAEAMMRRSLEIDDTNFGAMHPAVATDLTNLGLILSDMHRWSEAEPLMRRALAIDEASYGKTHPTVAVDLNNLARLLMDSGRPSEAEPLARRALEIANYFERSSGYRHPDRSTYERNHTALLSSSGESAKGIQNIALS
jgi:tetratricopeptide (TPR) repeat protein